MATRTVICLVFGLLGIAEAQNTGPTVLSNSRQAIGTRNALAGLRSLVLQGHTRNLVGSTGKLSDARPLEIRILLPDRYLHIQTNEFYETRSGFAGNELLNSARAVKADAQFGASYGPDQIGIERVAFVRLMLGLLAEPTQVLPLTIRPESIHTVHVVGPEGLSMFLDFDKATSLPARLRFEGNVHFPRPGTTMPPAPEKAEVVWTFEDRRDVNGLKLPHRVVRTARDVTLEDIRFETIRVNPPLTAKDFQKDVPGG